PYIDHAARVALRRIGNFEKAAKVGLGSTNPEIRRGTLVMLEQQYDAKAAKALADFAADTKKPADERAMAVAYLATLHRKYKPWDGAWWGTRPTRGTIPARELEWESTGYVLDQLRGRLSDTDSAVKLAAITSVGETRDTKALELLRGSLKTETETAMRVKVLEALAALKDTGSVPAIAALATDGSVGPQAMKSLGQIGDKSAAEAIVAAVTTDSLKASPKTIVAGLAALSGLESKDSINSSIDRLAALTASSSIEVRSAVVGLLANYPKQKAAVETLRKSLGDKSMEVVKSAIAALGKAEDRDSVPALLKLTAENATRFEAMTALADMADARATRIYLTGLTEKSPQLRRASSAALAKISTEAATTLDLLASRKELPSTALPELRKIYNRPVPIKNWQIVGPFGKGDNSAIDASASIDFNQPMVGRKGAQLKWQKHAADGNRGMVDLAKLLGSENDIFAFGVADLKSDVDRKAIMTVGSDDTLTVWVNGRQVYEFANSRGFNPDADSVEIDLKAGSNRIIIKCGNNGGPWQFAVGVSSPAEYAFLKGPAPGAFDAEEFRKKALAESGDAAVGLKLFSDVNGLACVKCHAVGGKGGAVGPDLTGIAGKYTLDEIASSILYPSAKIASGYESVIVATKDGRVITGVIKADTTSGVELEDAEAKRVRVSLDDIEERRSGDVSIMPNGLAEGLKPKDFADLLAYLATLKEQAKAATAKPVAAGGGE
ncbi:MAG: HEAT repeat domain-containing protein, partial [bacterium]